jgi:hypothetical protein
MQLLAHGDGQGAGVTEVAAGEIVGPGGEETFEAGEVEVELAELAAVGSAMTAGERVEVLEVDGVEVAGGVGEDVEVFGVIAREFAVEFDEVLELEFERAGVGFVEHEDVHEGDGLEGGVVAGAVGDGDG